LAEGDEPVFLPGCNGVQRGVHSGFSEFLGEIVWGVELFGWSTSAGTFVGSAQSFTTPACSGAHVNVIVLAS
jgi:hypothetical protein